MRPPYVDKYGVWNVEGKPLRPGYQEAVDRQVEANEGQGGWDQGPAGIAREMAEEAVDVTAWGRGFDQFDLSARQLVRAKRIFDRAERLWADIRALQDDLEGR